MRSILVVTVGAMALSACHKPTSASDTTPGASGGAPPASQSGPPHRRAGLWQTSVSVDGHSNPMGAMKLCVDAAMEAKSSAFHPSSPMNLGKSTHCAYPPPTRGADGSYSVTFTCPISGGGQTVTKASGAGDFSSAYHVHIES